MRMVEMSQPWILSVMTFILTQVCRLWLYRFTLSTSGVWTQVW